MSIITAVMGFLRTWIHVPLPLIFAEYLPKERYWLYIHTYMPKYVKKINLISFFILNFQIRNWLWSIYVLARQYYVCYRPSSGLIT